MRTEQTTGRDAIEPTSDWPVIGRLIALVALTVALLVGAFAALDAWRSARENAQDEQRAAEQLAAILSSHLWNFDYSGVQNVVATVIEREGVLAVSVTDAFGVKVHDSPATTVADAGTRTIRVPIAAPVHAQRDDKPIGEMTLTVPLTPIGHYLGQVMIRGLVAFVIVFIPCALVISIYLRRYVSTPLGQLSLAIRQTLQTGRHVQTEFSGDSMLGQLSWQFDRMQQRLRLTSAAREQLLGENHAIARELRRSLEMLQLESAGRQEQAEILNSVLLSINQFVSCFDSRDRLLVSNVPHSPDRGYFDALQSPPRSAGDLLEALAAQGFSGRVVPVSTPEPDGSGYHGNLLFAVEADGPDDSIWKVQVLAIRNGGKAIVGTDITEARRVASELLQTKKMDALGELTSGVAHDFNNILSVISGNLELASLQTGLDDTGRKHLEAALFACQRAEKRVTALLSYARREVVAPERVNVRDMIDELADILPNTLGENISLEMSNDLDLFVDVDPQHLYSALLNLAINARDAMPEGGTLQLLTSIADEDEVRAEQLDASRQYISIAVTDTGHGIPQATRDRIFEPFFTSKGKGKGTGLGLSIVFGFARQSGGAIRVTSAQGKGSAFTLFVPAAGRRAAAPPSTARQTPPPLNGVHALLVDDEPELLQIYGAWLRTKGMIVEIEPSFAGAMQRLQDAARPSIDLLMTDVFLRDGNGLDLVRAAKRVDPHLPVILISGNMGLDADLATTASPADLMLKKPLSLPELSAQIEVLLFSTRR